MTNIEAIEKALNGRRARKVWTIKPEELPADLPMALEMWMCDGKAHIFQLHVRSRGPGWINVVTRVDHFREVKPREAGYQGSQ